jgi:hypothetical protein
VVSGLKQAIIGASETDTVLVNRHNGKPMRVLLPAAEIVRQTVEEFGETLSALGDRYLRSSDPVVPTS